MRRRRTFLAAVGAGLATAIAGCGYQAGAGDLAWDGRGARGSTVTPSRSDRTWLADGESLFGVLNQSGRTHDFESGQWREFSNVHVSVYDDAGDRRWRAETDDRQYQADGEPAVADGSAYLPLEGGIVAAVGPDSEGDDGGEDDDGSEGNGGEVRWTAEVGEPDLRLAASGRLVVAAGEGAVHGFDPDDGETLFTIGVGADVPGVAVDGDRAWARVGGTESRLLALDTDGRRATAALPDGVRWLETAAGRAFVGPVEDGLTWGFDGGGERVVDPEVGGVAGDRPLVGGDRLYHVGRGELLAVDARSGERVWRRERSLPDERVATPDGLYAHGSLPDADGCGLVAIDADGEKRWSASVPDEPGCSGGLFALGDRLVVADDVRLYGFHARRGSRRSVV